MIISPWESLAVGDIYLSLHQILSFESFQFKSLGSRLSGHFGTDRNSALPVISKLFTDKWKKREVEIWSIWKIPLDMNNYQRYTLQKDYHLSLQRTDYGIKLDAFYNKFPPTLTFDEHFNTTEQEDTITIHVINKSKKWLCETLKFEPYTMMYVPQKEFDMLQYLIAKLSVK
jgi:hypothetical protein